VVRASSILIWAIEVRTEVSISANLCVFCNAVSLERDSLTENPSACNPTHNRAMLLSGATYDEKRAVHLVDQRMDKATLFSGCTCDQNVTMHLARLVRDCRLAFRMLTTPEISNDFLEMAQPRQ